MEWTDVTIRVPRAQLDAAVAGITAVFDGGLYIEDYSDLEEQVQAIAHVDLIEEELLQKPREEASIHLYISPDENPAEAVGTLRQTLAAAQVLYTLALSGVQQEDWENAWKQHYHALEVGEWLVVVPSWEEYRGARIQLRLDPGMAFGTGTHETTFLCLEALDEQVRSGVRVLDIGTGSGILAVAALLLGADSALGVDIDPMAVRTANENALRNGVEGQFQAVCGDLAAAAEGTYDIITANIVADAILRLAPQVPALLAPEGLFVASGILTERAAEVAAALAGMGFGQVETREKNGWVALLARR